MLTTSMTSLTNVKSSPPGVQPWSLRRAAAAAVAAAAAAEVAAALAGFCACKRKAV
jgi:hypothetical protein